MFEGLTLAGGTDLIAGGNPYCVHIVGRWAYIGTAGALVVVDVADAGNPTETYSFVEANTTNEIDEIDIVGNYAYIASSDYFSILDISDPSNITTLGQISGAGEYLDNISGFRIRGDYAYITASTSDALVVVDISNPENPTRVGQISGSANYLNGASCVELYGNYAFVAAPKQLRFSTFDISDPENPTVAGSLYKVVGAFASNRDMVRNGNYIYLVETYTYGGIVVIDITSPTSPSWYSHVTGYDDGFFQPSKIRLNGDYLFVSCNSEGSYQAGITVYDISNIIPVYAGRYEGTDLTNYDSEGVYVDDTFVYVTYTSLTHSFYIFGRSYTAVSRTTSQAKPPRRELIDIYRKKVSREPKTEISDKHDYVDKRDYNVKELLGTVGSKIEDALVTPGDIAKDIGLESAVIMSLFTDRRAKIDDTLPDESGNRRGWWGDQASPEVANDEIGSYLWLLERSKTTNDVLEIAEQYAKNALQWMVDDKVVSKITVDVKRAGEIPDEVLFLRIKLYREYEDSYAPMYEGNWGLQII